MAGTDGPSESGGAAPRSAERVLWRGRPDPRVALPPALAGLALAGLGLWLPRTVGLADWLPLLVVLAGVIVAAAWTVYARRTRYVVTEDRVYRRNGLVGNVVDLPLSGVTAVDRDGSGLGGLVGAETVEVTGASSGSDADAAPEPTTLTMEYVGDADRLVGLLSDLRREAAPSTTPATGVAESTEGEPAERRSLETPSVGAVGAPDAARAASGGAGTADAGSGAPARRASPGRAGPFVGTVGPSAGAREPSEDRHDGDATGRGVETDPGDGPSDSAGDGSGSGADAAVPDRLADAGETPLVELLDDDAGETPLVDLLDDAERPEPRPEDETDVRLSVRGEKGRQ